MVLLVRLFGLHFLAGKCRLEAAFLTGVDPAAAQRNVVIPVQQYLL
jgi:hypothetical protein